MASDRNSFKGKVLKGFAWLSLGTFVGQLVTWLSTLFVIRLLSPSDYGLMAMAGSFIALIAIFNDLGLSAGIVQMSNIEEQEIHQIFTLVLIASLSGFILCYYTAPVVARFYGEHRLVPVIRVMSLNFILSAFFMVPQSLLIREMNFQTKAKVDIVSRITSSILTLILAICSMGVWALVLGEICSYMVRAIGFNLVRRRCLMFVANLTGSLKYLKFGLSITSGGFLYFLFSQSDIIIAGKFLGKDELGVYSIALNLASIPSEKVMPLITQVSFTAYARIQDDLERIRRNLLKAVRMVGNFAFPVFFGMAAVAPETIRIALGLKWEGLILPFQLLCLILPMRTLSFLFAPALFAIGKPIINVVNMSITLSIMSLAFMIGVKFGILGLCTAWIIAYPIVFTITTRRSLKAIALPIKAFAGYIVFPFIASSLMLLSLVSFRVLSVMSFGPKISLMGYIITGAAIYFSFIAVFKVELLHEFKTLFKK
jgi:teichuronic acid exporter